MKHRIVVLGAGYAGTHAAGRLARRLHAADTEITLVNADSEFVERVRLHQVAAGQDLPRRRLSDVYAGTPVTVRQARVTAVDAGNRTVQLDDGELGYDTLVYALGSTSDDHGVPGVAGYAYPLAGLDAAMRLRERLSGLAPGSAVLVAGGGLTGIEAATEIAESRPDLTVAIAARDGVGDWLSDKAQRHLRTVFGRLRITVHEHAAITAVEADGVRTGSGRIPADLTVWAAGFTTHPIAAASALQVAANGQIVADATMRSVSHPEVYAVGDAGITDGPGGKPLRMSCASGIPMAWQAADSIAARLTGRSLPKSPVRYFSQCISLGRRDGIIQVVTADDRATSTAVTGALAARMKELVCAGAGWSIAHPTVLLPTRRRRIQLPTSSAAMKAVG
ncbi:FAD-dependent oxidoreductase [Actinoplanes sp. NBC_00393]|uniref:NAD(P)/FAD-dependent oxidoreductase n=1 Tax=Actinoplanes sp. NBC_00393 TaxID=2975953 RepID=UPI002E204DB5